MKILLFDCTGRMRNGVWVLAFFGFVAVTRVLYRPVKHGLEQLGAAAPWLELLPVLLILLATWACTRLRREPLASVGLAMGRRWFSEAAWGLVFGVGSLLLVAGLIAVAGGVRFELDPARGMAAFATGAWFFACAAVLEEMLFRGFVFQRLVAGVGAWPTQLALACLFAAGHWANPGMEGLARVIASVDLGLAALLLGIAYLRTRSLALPIGLHLGWNFAQGPVFGFAVSGYTQPGWFRPVLQHKAEWLSGGAFGPEASVFAIAVDAAAIALLLFWPRSDAQSRSLPSIELTALTH